MLTTIINWFAGSSAFFVLVSFGLGLRRDYLVDIQKKDQTATIKKQDITIKKQHNDMIVLAKAMPRQFGSGDKADIMRNLSQFKRHEMDFNCLLMDSKNIGFAKALAESLRDAGWKINLSATGLENPGPMTGLRIHCPNKISEAAKALTNYFRVKGENIYISENEQDLKHEMIDFVDPEWKIVPAESIEPQ